MESLTEITLLNPDLCNIDFLVHKQHHKDYQQWYDQNQNKEYYEYKLYGWPNERQMEIYQFRKNIKQHIVYVHYLAPVNNSCFKQFSVFIQKIYPIFSTLIKFSFNQGIYILKNALTGFHLLFEKFGYVHIDNKLIGLNNEGNIKVWINENFVFNGIATTHLAPKWMSEEMKQKQMIATIFSIVQDKLQKNEKLQQFKKQKQLKVVNITFETILKFIDDYINIHKMIIPLSMPQFIQIMKKQNTKIQFSRGSNNQKQFLSFKNYSSKRKNNKNSIIQLRNFKNNFNGCFKGKRLMTLNNRFLCPNQNTIRARNRSDTGFSIASSRPRTTFTIRQSKPTKYFLCNKNSKGNFEILERQNNFLESSQISRDFCFLQSNKNQIQILPNKHIQSKIQKKRKYSAADKMIITALNITPKVKEDKTIALALARSMILKNKLQESRKMQNNNFQRAGIAHSQSSSPIKNLVRPSSPQRNNPQSQFQSQYQSGKTFLNYKSVNKSIINNNKQCKKQSKRQLMPNLKNSFLKNMAMKNSQIIMQKSSQYASIQDMMNTIKQSQIQTPSSDQCFQTFTSVQRKASLFVGNVRQRKNSDINISNSTTDRKSGLQQGKDGNLINFASPTKHKQLKQGMFKSIFVQESRQQQVSEIQQQT